MKRSQRLPLRWLTMSRIDLVKYTAQGDFATVWWPVYAVIVTAVAIEKGGQVNICMNNNTPNKERNKLYIDEIAISSLANCPLGTYKRCKKAHPLRRTNYLPMVALPSTVAGSQCRHSDSSLPPLN